MKFLKTKSIISLVLYLHVMSSAFGATKTRYIFVQSSAVKDAEFKAFVKNVPSAITLSEYMLEASPTVDDQKNLLRILESAQREYLEGSLEKAKQSFELLVKVSRDADWSIEERKSIFYAYLRLAQLSEDTQRHNWLAEAVRFDFELSADKKIFPPPLLKELESIRRDEIFNSKNWDINGFKENIVYIRVNGKKYNTQYGGSIKLMNGQNRVVLVSNKKLPIVRILNINQILALTIPNSYFENPDCKNPVTDDVPASIKARAALYFDEGCILISESDHWVTKTSALFLNNTKYTTIESQLVTSGTVQPKIENHIDSEIKSESSNKLWLIGLVAAGITTALIISSKKSTDPSKQPTHQ